MMTKNMNKPEFAILNDVFVTVASQILNSLLLHDVAACVERAGQRHATFSTFSTQHVDVYVPQAPGAKQVDLARMP